MKQGIVRILTTHTGSLPRPEALVALLQAQEQGKSYHLEALTKLVRTATAEIVRQQLACGVDVVNDGETEEIGYSTYVKDRLSGFDGTASPLEIADLMDLPGCSERLFRATSFMAKQYRGAREW